MNRILQGVLIEELNRNLEKQVAFKNELSKHPKGSLCICKIHGDEYLYRKYRDQNAIVSEYVGKIDSSQAQKAFESRRRFLELKKSIKNLLIEEKRLRKIIKIYG